MKCIINHDRTYPYQIVNSNNEIVAVGYDAETAWATAACKLDIDLFTLKIDLRKLCDEHS